jgi:hypothetical protein
VGPWFIVYDMRGKVSRHVTKVLPRLLGLRNVLATVLAVPKNG